MNINNPALLEAQIASRLISLPQESTGIKMMELISDISKAVAKFNLNANIDKRYIALGVDDDRQFYHDVMSQPGSDFYEVLRYAYERIATILIMSGSSRKKVLLSNPTIHVPVVASYKEFLGVEEVSFINNADAFIYEQAVRDKVAGAINEYAVFDREDIGSSVTNYFDLIGIHGIEAVSDFDIIERMANSLVPGGQIVINGTGKGRNYFTPAYFSHELFKLHKFLHSLDGSTLHLLDLAGVTIFIKN